MIPDPEYTVKKVEVWRVVGPDGKELTLEDDHGEYPLDFDSHEAAFQDAVRRMQCRVPYGPKTQKEQAFSDSMADMGAMMKRHYRFRLDTSAPLPHLSNETIQFIRSA